MPRLSQKTYVIIKTTKKLGQKIIITESWNNMHAEDNAKSHKKLFFAILAIAIIIPVGILLFSIFFGFGNFSWDESYLSTDTTFVTQTKLKLGVIFSDKDKANEIKWETNCGKIEGTGTEIIWDLLKTTGPCEITASYKLKSIKRTLSVLPFNFREKDLALEYEIDEDSDEDLDYDGLTNKQEKEYGTNPQVYDTDLDGLDDYYEIFTSKTDPNKKDSDDDGLNDYDEIQLKLDPLNADSKGDGTKDGQRELTYNYESDKLKLSITGTGNIASTVTEVNPNTKIGSKKGLTNNLYTLYTDGEIKEATLIIPYTNEELTKYELKEDNLSIYYYNEKESKYEKMDSVVDKSTKTVTAKLHHFSNYVLGDSNVVKETSSNQVLFVLDNSWSLYTNEQYEQYTGKEYKDEEDLDGFDAKGVRFTLTGELATNLSAKNFKIGLSEFRNDYANALEIGSSADSIKEKLGTMTGKFITKREGTNIDNALTRGIKEFSKESDNKYIILLTDGRDTGLKSHSKNIINEAIKNNVKICAIGFGSGAYNAELANISNGTGCKFYSSGDAMGLTELFDNIETELDDDLVDVDEDNASDGILIADSGFIVNRDGFSFSNYGTNLSEGGHCYGMATFAELYYKGVMPMSSSAKTIKKQKSYSYDLSGTYFESGANLYDYKLKTNALKYNFGFDLFGEEQPTDFRKLNGTTLALNDAYKKEITDSGMYDIVEEETVLDSDAQLKKWGMTYETSENVYLNEDNMQTSSVIENDDLQLFNALYMSFIKQDAIAHYSSASNFTLWARDKIGSESIDYSGATGFINILKTRLENKDAPVLSAKFNNGLHAINAISLIQDIENPNIYHIGVYDNVYPGEKRYVDLECNKKACVTKANEYYTSSGEPVRITPSIETDIEYYKD